MIEWFVGLAMAESERVSIPSLAINCTLIPRLLFSTSLSW